MANTPNLGLHQWSAGDSFLRTDFNSDFSKIDTAVNNIWKTVETATREEVLIELTTTVATNRVDLDVSRFNWSKYREFRIWVDCATVTSNSLLLRVNGLSGNVYDRMSSSGSAQKSTELVSWTAKTSATLSGYPGGVEITLRNLGGILQAEYTGIFENYYEGEYFVSVDHTFSGISPRVFKAEQLTSLNIMTDNNTNIAPGMRIFLIGIRK